MCAFVLWIKKIQANSDFVGKKTRKKSSSSTPGANEIINVMMIA